MRFAALCTAVLLATPAVAHAQPEWRLVPELRIGSVDDEDQSLTVITSVTVAADGTIYLPQRQDQNIRVYDRTGKLLRIIGGKGGGPGEFEGLVHVGILRDTLYAPDFRHRRVTFFTMDGELIGTLPISVGRTSTPYSPGGVSRMLEDGSVLGTLGALSRAIATGEVTHVPTLRADREGTVLDTVYRMPLGSSQLSLKLGNGEAYTAQPYPDSPIGAWSDDGILEVEREATDDAREGFFRLTWISFSGDTTLVRRYRYAPHRLDAAVGDSIIDAIAARFTDWAARVGASRNDLVGQLRRGIIIPRHLPPITAALIAQNGDVWLRRENVPGATVRWNVLSGQGDVLALFSLPKRVRPIHIDATHVYAAETDDLDVPYLVRYRIDRGSR